MSGKPDRWRCYFLCWHALLLSIINNAMGVTIHFSGRLKKSEDLETVISLGREFAMRKHCEVTRLDSEKKLLIRFKDGEECDYEGPVRGIQFHPDENCEPFVLEFDNDLFIQERCKTQFAGISTHVEVIQLLRNIEPYFESLVVVDEGGFWETTDIAVLEQKFEVFFVAAEQMVKANPKLRGPIRLVNGRILDLIG